jgi:HPt (histidine-containing phosphotransfer) domain-containing protein
MLQPNSSKKFIFSGQMDSDYLQSLYEDDFQYIEEIFGTTLSHFDPDFAAVQQAYEAGDLASLKKAIHKIKPTFGFVGLLRVQEICGEFENICQKANSTSELNQQYQQIVTTLAASKALIAAEYNKLKDYNSNHL